MSSFPSMSGLLTPLLTAQAERSMLLPPQASTLAQDSVDPLFWFITYVALFFFVLVVGIMVVFVWLYRDRPGHGELPSPNHNTALEVTWTVIPVIVVIVIFTWGYLAYLDMATPPANAEEVYVTGFKWAWDFHYPKVNANDSVLHVPLNRPVRLRIGSEDVIHSVFIPAFRVKMDAVPGRYTTAWFQATMVGEFDLFCAEYCGTEHSSMITKVIVYEPGEYDKVMENLASWWEDVPSPREVGEIAYNRKGCVQCHSVDGSPGIGPSFLGKYGEMETMSDGSRVLFDENYIRESILEPNARITAGYEPVMPTYMGRLKEPELEGLIEYIKSLGHGQASDETEPAAQESGG